MAETRETVVLVRFGTAVTRVTLAAMMGVAKVLPCRVRVRVAPSRAPSVRAGRWARVTAAGVTVRAPVSRFAWPAWAAAATRTARVGRPLMVPVKVRVRAASVAVRLVTVATLRLGISVIRVKLPGVREDAKVVSSRVRVSVAPSRVSSESRTGADARVTRWVGVTARAVLVRAALPVWAAARTRTARICNPSTSTSRVGCVKARVSSASVAVRRVTPVRLTSWMAVTRPKWAGVSGSLKVLPCRVTVTRA